MTWVTIIQKKIVGKFDFWAPKGVLPITHIGGDLDTFRNQMNHLKINFWGNFDIVLGCLSIIVTLDYSHKVKYRNIDFWYPPPHKGGGGYLHIFVVIWILFQTKWKTLTLISEVIVILHYAVYSVKRPLITAQIKYTAIFTFGHQKMEGYLLHILWIVLIFWKSK